MKNLLLIATVLLSQLLCTPAHAQRRAAGAQATPRQMQYATLNDYVNDYDKRRNGERLIVSGVPLVLELSRGPAGLYDLKVSEDGGVGANFVTSAALAKSLRPHLKSDAANLRVTCTLVEFAGEFDVYRTSFATKVEGLDESGAVLWTATGTAPARLKFRQ